MSTSPSADWLAGSTVQRAKDLLGFQLKVLLPDTSSLLCRIVETEAYTQDDPACHAYQKATGRAANLYKVPGTVYVYLIYGMYHCLNIVTEPEGQAGAVLIRAVEPINYPLRKQSPFQTHGPGRLCKALGITTNEHNGCHALDSTSAIRLLPPSVHTTPGQIITTTRIGISKAVDYPWRFYDPNSEYVSVRDKTAESCTSL